MLYHRLRELDQRGTPIQIGLIAAGTFGTQIASQLAHAPGMRLTAIAELDLAKARRAYGRGQIPDDQIDTADDPCGHWTQPWRRAATPSPSMPAP